MSCVLWVLQLHGVCFIFHLVSDVSDYLSVSRPRLVSTRLATRRPRTAVRPPTIDARLCPVVTSPNPSRRAADPDRTWYLRTTYANEYHLSPTTEHPPPARPGRRPPHRRAETEELNK